MSAPPVRRWMLGLSLLLVVAQLADLMWPRADSRGASPASIAVAGALVLLLALYPNGKAVPRWTVVVAVAAFGLFVIASVLGPEVSTRLFWPLPLAPFLLALVFGGQGYRYVRRSSADEREAVRWPLLGLLLLLTITVPADGIAVAVTGATLGAPSTVTAIVDLAFLLPGLGFLAGLIAPRTELVDRLLSAWVAVVVAAAVLGAVFAGVFAVAGVWCPPPWPAWIGAAAVAAASVPAVPTARRIGRILVFRGRTERRSAAALLDARLRTTLDLADVPAEVARTIADAIGSRGVTLRRSGQQTVWAAAGESSAEGWQTTVVHLGLPLARIDVLPRAGETTLASEDRRIVEALASASAPALHGARLASAFPELTERERQVLAGIVRGLPNRAIAERLGVSAKTVANYVSIVLTKLRVPDKERAAELARRRGAELG